MVFCSAVDDTTAKVRALQLGAVDFIAKPFDPPEVVARVSTHLAIRRLLVTLDAHKRALERQLTFARDSLEEALRRAREVLVGDSYAVTELRATIARLGQTDEPILLAAAPGCGDEAVARAIHDASARRDRPFVHVACPLLRNSDVPGLLHAHRGAPARLSTAHGGTVFFEGVHRMPTELARAFWSLLCEEAGATRSGLATGRDIRLIASVTTTPTTLPPNDAIEEFRQRTGRQPVHLPTLRERHEDIPALVDGFAERHARLLGRTIDGVATGTMATLTRHTWPGNLRELEEVVRNGVLQSPRSTLEVDARQLGDGIPFAGYRLLRQLSEGGMGALWEARHQLLARPAVVKAIRADQPGSVRALLERRFALEARATARLRCPHTVTLFDYGRSDDGVVYYVMELLDGIDLEAVVRRFGALPATRVAHLLLQACASLAEAHAVGLVHRDVKPSNLFLSRLGLEVDVHKVLDFGVVKWQRHEAELPTGLCGTPGYIAPEAAADPAAIDGQVDVYALGCVAYLLLTGSTPFQAANPAALVMKHVLEAPTPPSQRSALPIPEVLERLVLQCLAKDPRARPDAGALRDALEGTGLAAGWDRRAAERWWADHLPARLSADDEGVPA